ncbi:hypothetical protein [Actinoallomurus acaciae]|uniref:Uncharacterized protein n=1 Tax=Actinoallomurus acaciae TaxID=502577 RepID=A0ABV5YBR0_9ACTN
MSSERVRPGDDAWQVFAALHRLLLRLAGRFPDELITRTRTMLARSDLVHLPDTVTGSAARLRVSLTAADVELLRYVLALADGAAGDPAATDQLTISTSVPATDHRFTPVPPGAPAVARVSADLADDLLVDAMNEHLGVMTIRRAWRSAPHEESEDARRVYFVEVEPHVRAWELTGDAQHELVLIDEESPQVEVYWTGDELPPYHRTALADAALLWPRSPPAGQAPRSRA